MTGAGGGIGRGIARALAEEGMRLVPADLDAGGLRTTGAELRGSGAEAIEVVTGVRDAGAVESLAAATLDAYGAVHVLCDNAGVWTLGRQWETELADWRWVVDVNRRPGRQARPVLGAARRRTTSAAARTGVRGAVRSLPSGGWATRDGRVSRRSCRPGRRSSP